MKKIKLSILLLAIIAVLTGSSSVGIAQTADIDLENSIGQLRQERQAFKDAKKQEEAEKQQAIKEKIQDKRQQAEQRRVEAENKRETKRKAVLLSLIDIQIKHFNKTNDRVQKMPNITDDLKAQLKKETSAAIGILEGKKIEVKSSISKEEIKKLAGETKDLFKMYREIVKKIVEAIHSSRADKAVSVAEDRAAVIKTKVKELKDKGQDTSEIDNDLIGVEKEISEAKSNLGRKAFKEANENLKGVYQKFREIAEKAKKIQ
jgi:hypothetical protein